MRAKGFYAVIYFRRVHLYTRLQPQGGRKNFLLLFVSLRMKSEVDRASDNVSRASKGYFSLYQP